MEIYPLSNGHASSGTFTTVNPALGSQAGDLNVIAVFTAGGANTATITPAGWNALFGPDGVRPLGRTDCAGNVFWRIWTGTPATQRFDVTVAGTIVAVSSLLRGVDQERPIESSAYDASLAGLPANTDVPAPSLTPVKARTLLTVHGGRGTSANIKPTWTQPPGMQEVNEYSSQSASFNAYGCIDSKSLSGGAPTGVQGAKCTSGLYPIAFSILVREAGIGAASTVRMKGGVPVTVRYKGQP